MNRDIDLNRVRVTGPCDRSWDSLTPIDGNERARFCGECQRNVYDLAAMNGAEARDLLRTARGRLCMQVSRRSDGRVITRDPPVPVVSRWRRWWAAAVAVLGVAGLSACPAGLDAEDREAARSNTVEDSSGTVRSSGVVGRRIQVPTSAQPFDPESAEQWSRESQDVACEEPGELTANDLEALQSLGYISYIDD